MKVKLRMKGVAFPQTADIAEEEINKLEGTRIEWWNEYKNKKGQNIRHRHITFNNPDAVIQDIEFMGNDEFVSNFDLKSNELPEE